MERSGNTTQSAIETWRPTIKRLPRAVVLFVAAAAFIAACSSGPDSSRTVESTFANHSTPSDLAQSSEYLIRGTVNSDGSRVTLNKEAALAYMVSDVIVTEILGERPDAPIDLKVGEAISVGVGVLDERERSSVVNFDELAERFPTEDQALGKSQDVYLYLVYTELGESGPGYEAVGHAVIVGGQIAWNGFPGDLAATTASPSAIDATIEEFDGPAPWRQSDNPDTEVPRRDEGRAPLMQPASGP